MRNDFRSRLVGIFAALIIAAFLLMLLTTRQVMIRHHQTTASETITQEMEEFSAFSSTSQTFSSAQELLEVYLERQSPDAGEALAGITNGTLIETSHAPRPLSANGELIREATNSPEATGTFEDPEHGHVVWGRVPIADGSGTENTSMLVVARFVEADRGAIGDNMRIISVAAAGSSALAIFVAWLTTTRFSNSMRLINRQAAANTYVATAEKIETTGDGLIDSLANSFNDLLLRLDTSDDAHRGVMRRAVAQLEQEETRAEASISTLSVLRDLESLPVGRRVTHNGEVDVASLADRLRTVAVSEVEGELRTEGFKLHGRTAEIDPDLVALALRHGIRSANTRASGQITVGLEATDTHLQLWVDDHARSVENASLPTFFDWNTEHFPEGQPHLNHAVMRIVADLHGGQAFAETTTDSGTRIGLMLPLQQEVS